MIRDHCEMRSSVTGSGLLVNNISRSSISGSIFYCNYKFFVNLLLERTSAVTIFLGLCCHCFIYLEKKQENVARSKIGILIYLRNTLNHGFLAKAAVVRYKLTTYSEL